MATDHNEVNQLLDYYAVLLNEKQRIYMSLYYYEDFSLSEVAEQVGVSRNAVHDMINRTKQLLISYEDKLHLVAKDQCLKRLRTCQSMEAVRMILKEIELFEEGYDGI